MAEMERSGNLDNFDVRDLSATLQRVMSDVKTGKRGKDSDTFEVIEILSHMIDDAVNKQAAASGTELNGVASKGTANKHALIDEYFEQPIDTIFSDFDAQRERYVVKLAPDVLMNYLKNRNHDVLKGIVLLALSENNKPEFYAASLRNAVWQQGAAKSLQEIMDSTAKVTAVVEKCKECNIPEEAIFAIINSPDVNLSFNADGSIKQENQTVIGGEAQLTSGTVRQDSDVLVESNQEKPVQPEPEHGQHEPVADASNEPSSNPTDNEKKPVDSSYVPTPISWDEIKKMNFSGKTNFAATRTFDNKYPIYKVKNVGEMGQFVEYGKTPNGDIILVPNPKYYNDKQPILDKGVTVFGLFFDIENKYMEGSSMEIVPAVICNFNTDTILPNDALISRGSAKTLSKKNVPNDDFGDKGTIIGGDGVKADKKDKKDLVVDQHEFDLAKRALGLGANHTGDRDFIETFARKMHTALANITGDKEYSVAINIDPQLVLSPAVFYDLIEQYSAHEQCGIRADEINSHAEMDRVISYGCGIISDTIKAAAARAKDTSGVDGVDKRGAETDVPENERDLDFYRNRAIHDGICFDGEPTDKYIQYRQEAMEILKYKSVTGKNIAAILDMELDLYCEDHGIDPDTYEDPEDNYYNIIEYVQDITRGSKRPGIFSRIAAGIKKRKKQVPEDEMAKLGAAVQEKADELGVVAQKEGVQPVPGQQAPASPVPSAADFLAGLGIVSQQGQQSVLPGNITITPEDLALALEQVAKNGRGVR